MNNNTDYTNNMNQTTTTPEHLDYQDMPDIAQLKEGFPFCKSAKIGNLLYPVIASSKLMEFIAFDDNFVAAAREIKHHAFNPSGSEHGVVKKVCDMFIDNPSFREIICQDLIQGIYAPERIAADSAHKTDNGIPGIRIIPLVVPIAPQVHTTGRLPHGSFMIRCWETTTFRL